MEAELVAELPAADGWQYEPKWDGFEHGGNQVSPVGPLLKQQTLVARLACGEQSSPPATKGGRFAGT